MTGLHVAGPVAALSAVLRAPDGATRWGELEGLAADLAAVECPANVRELARLALRAPVSQ